MHLIIEGKYQIKPEPPFSPGFEVAGVVKEVAPGVTGFDPGDRVMASLPGAAMRKKSRSTPPISFRCPMRWVSLLRRHS